MVLSSYAKIITVGEIKTGKSCLIKRFCEKRFVSRYLPTIGVDFGVTKYELGGKELKINLFDLSGNSAFLEVRNEFYKDTHGVFIVYDVSVRETFLSLDSWMHEMSDYLSQRELDGIVFVLCGNKCDKKTTKRAVEWGEAHLWAQQNGCLYVETSAMSGDGVDNAFQSMFNLLFDTVVCAGTNSRKTKVFTKNQLAAIQQLKGSTDNYKRLGLSQGASINDINKAYRRTAKLLHPDKCSVAGSEEAFKLLSTARDTLLKRQ